MQSKHFSCSLIVEQRLKRDRRAGAGRFVCINHFLSAGLLDERNALDLDFIAAAIAASGEVVARAAQNIRATLPPSAVQQITSRGLAYIKDLELTPGEYAVRLVVRDNLTGRIGSVVAPLKVKSVPP